MNDRERELERLLGDPFDPANHLGFDAVLRADEQAHQLPGGQAVLDAWGCNAEFVPATLDGRWADTDDLSRRLRPIFRRDGALGLSYGVTSLMAAINVWVAGDAAQQQRLSRALLGGEVAAVAFHELAHGNDLLGNDFSATVDGPWLLLNGVKEVVNNIDRADAVVLFARTQAGSGGRSHSLLYLDRAHLSAPGVLAMPRFASSAVRGCELGGIRVRDALVPAGTMVGLPGTGVETALRAFQITRTVLPSMALGALDTALHVVHRFAGERQLYGRPLAEIPQARSTLAAAFTDLLIADCLATSVARSLHLAPRHAAAPSAATKYLVPKVMEEALQDLSVLLGARFYLREGPEAIVGKLCRDAPVVALGHAGSTACLLTIVPLLPLLARRAWLPAPAPTALFDHDASLPELDFGDLAVAGTGRDVLIAALLVAAEKADSADETECPVFALIADLTAELRRLAQSCAALTPRDLGPDAAPEVFALAERYAVLLAAAACTGVWLHHRGDRRAGILARPVWIHAALIRLSARLSGDVGLLPPDFTEAMYTELGNRTHRRLSCCLRPTPLFGCSGGPE